MMDSTYLEPAGEGALMDEAGGEVQGTYPWVGGIEPTAISHPGLDLGSYIAASPTSLDSPETLILDQPLFPSPLGNFAYLDRPYGVYLPVSYSTGGVSQELFSTLTDRCDSTAVLTASLCSSIGAWPTQASSILPPLTVSDLSNDSALEDEDGRSSDEEAPNAASGSSKSKKRPCTQLRTASRVPKKRANILPLRPTETIEDVKARAVHNQVEKKYRTQLNLHFEQLLSVLTVPKSTARGRRDGDRRVSKAKVLDLATERIKGLEREIGRLEREKRELRVRLGGCVSVV